MAKRGIVSAVLVMGLVLACCAAAGGTVPASAQVLSTRQVQGRTWDLTVDSRALGKALNVRLLLPRLAVEQQLIDDDAARGWAREVERHQATRARLEQLLRELGGRSHHVAPEV